MLFRALAYMIGSILLITLLRSVIGAVLRFASGLAMGQAQGRQGGSASARPRKAPVGEPLKKDPVCGTFVAPSVAVAVTKGGETYYFCSAECRDKF